MRDLSGATALVTGASGQIGELRAELARGGHRAEVAVADLGDLSTPESLVGSATDLLGDGIDLLICVAGRERSASLAGLDDGDIAGMLIVDLIAPTRLVRQVLPGMLARGRGHVVMVGSVAALAGGAYQVPYAAAKAGLDATVRGLRAEHPASGVGFSVVHPGPTRGAGAYRARRRIAGPVPPALGETTPDRVAAAVMNAIRRDRPQIVVAPRPVRALLALQALFPGVAERVVQASGVTRYLRRTAADDPPAP